MRVYAICPKCKRRVVYTPSEEDVKLLRESGIASVSFDHGDHIFVLFFDKDGRARGTEVHRFVSKRRNVMEGLRKIDELSIEKLPIDERVKKKLAAKGLLLIKDVIWFHPTRLSEFADIDHKEAEKIVEIALNLYERIQGQYKLFLPASDISRKEMEKHFLHTGSKNLDRILMGGYASGEVTELVGEYRTGKSQLCYTAIATAFLPPEAGGLNVGDISVVLIDSERTFHEKRMISIFKRFNLDWGELSEKVLIGQPTNSIHQKRMIDALFNVIKSNNVKLVIVDSLTKLPRIDFENRGELYKRQRLILNIVETLRRLAKTYNITVLITNQVVSDLSKEDEAKPIGGHVLSHSVDTRIYLSYIEGSLRRATIVDSSWLPSDEAIIKISEEGVVDPENLRE
ncbi:MAG: ATPase domain-containing protein [Candidatus Njordarchaeia archaeon]